MSDPDVEKLGEAAAIPRDNTVAHRISNSSFRMTNAACTNNVQDSAKRSPTSRRLINSKIPGYECIRSVGPNRKIVYISGECVSEPVIRQPNHKQTQGRPSTKSPVHQRVASLGAHIDELPAQNLTSNNGEFVARLRETYGPNVLNFSQKKKYVAVNVASLQKAHVECIQNQLIESAFDFTYGAADQVGSRLRQGGELIHRYGK